MRATLIRTAASGAVLLAALVGCGAGPTTATSPATPSTATAAPMPPSSPSASPAPTSSPAPSTTGSDADRAAVVATFGAYNDALLARDFAGACGLSAPETVAALVSNVSAQIGAVADCPAAFTAIYATPGTGEQADAVARSTRVETVTITGEQAVVGWTAELGANRSPVITSQLRRDGAGWLLVDTGQS